LTPEKVLMFRRAGGSKKPTHLIVQFREFDDPLDVNYDRMLKDFPAFMANYEKDKQDDDSDSE
jgi:hypothetical protein